MSLKLAIVYGSVRSERVGIRIVRFLERAFAARGHEVTTVDPLEYKLPLMDRMYKEYPAGGAPKELDSLAAVWLHTDAIVVVSGEYNHSVPPALSNLLDYFLEQFYWRPSAIVSYSAGPFGGVRAAMQLRAMLCELGMPSIPTTMPVSKVKTAFSEDGTPTDPVGTERRFTRFALELEWYAGALKAHRSQGVPY
jgi:NAD(P)H-dependent FMN reductase